MPGFTNREYMDIVLAYGENVFNFILTITAVILSTYCDYVVLFFLSFSFQGIFYTSLCGRTISDPTMGNKLLTFTEEQLENYQDCTFFTRKEILRVYKRYREIRPDLVPKQMKQNEQVTIRIPLEDITEKLPELRENPFRKRICKVFSRDGKGNLSFEDILDLLSVFSEQAPRDIKVYYAFRIYDFDDDHYIGTQDLDSTLVLLMRHELSPEDRQQIIEKAIEEADVDGDGKLSYMEFEHVITRAPDFLSTFHIRI